MSYFSRISRGPKASFFIFSLLLLLSGLCASCARQMDPVPEPPVLEPVQDSVCFLVAVDSAAFPVRSLDVLVYSSEGTQDLEAHRRLEGHSVEQDIKINLLKGEKKLVAVANSSRPLNLASLSRYDGAKALSFEFNEDDKSFPLMSAEADFKNNKAELKFHALRGYVMLSSISNGLDDYELLEEPRVRLRFINNSAKILQFKDFYPTEMLDYGPWTDLPYDIGLYPQEPGTVLYCFPNSTAAAYSTSSTQFEFECKVLGEVCSYLITLPAIERSDTVRVELSVAGRYDYSSRVTAVTASTLQKQLLQVPAQMKQGLQ